MTFPTIPTTAGGTLLFSTAVGSGAARTFPNLSSLTKNSGDLLIAVAVAYQSSASAGAVWSGWPTGWTEFADVGGGTSSMTIGAAWKISTGSETGTFTITQAATITGDCVMWLMAIPGAHATQAPEHTAIATGTTSVASAGALTPSWGSDDNLFIAIGGNGETSITGTWTGAGTSPPTNYTGLVNAAVADTSTVGQADSSIAFRQLTASTDTIGNFSGGDVSNARNAAMGIVVRPAPPVSATGPAAQVSLASLSTPRMLSGYTLHFRARVQTSATAATLRANLWEGATDRSGVLESSPLTTSLAEYSLAIPDVNAAAIVNYANLSASFWGYSSDGETPVIEVADVWFVIPPASAVLTRTSADANLSSDAATRRDVLARTAVEASLSSDAGTRAAVYPRSGTDASVSTDSAARKVGLTRTGAETSLSSDVATKGSQAALIRTSADTSVSSDADTRAAAHPRGSADTSVSSDSAAPRVGRTRTSADASLSSDSAVRRVGLHLTAADVSVSVDSVGWLATHTGFSAFGNEISSSFDVASSNAIRPLSVYLGNTAATTLTTANQLVTAAPSSETSAASGQYASGVTGFSNLYSQGGNNTVLATDPAANVHGFLYDSTVLEGQTIQAGAWTVKLKLSAVATGFTVKVLARLWKRTASGTYSQLTSGGVPVEMASGAVALSSSATPFTLSAVAVDAVTFSAGDKLYLDVVANITVGSTNATASNRVINLFMNGGAAESVVSPGYALSTSLLRSAADTSLSSDVAVPRVALAVTAADTSLSADVAVHPAAISRSATDTSLSADSATVPISLSNNFEGGTGGATVTTSNSGGASGTAFDSVVIGVGEGLTFDGTNPAHGSGLGLKVQNAATIAVTYVAWTTSLGTLPINQTLFGRFYYVVPDTTPAGLQKPLAILHGSVQLAAVAHLNSGVLSPLNSSGASVGAGTQVLAANTLYRIEFQFTGLGTAAGGGQINLYAGDSTTPLDTINVTAGSNFGGTAPDTVRFGQTNTNGVASGAIYFDALNVNTIAFPGPEAAGPQTLTATGADTSLSSDTVARGVVLARSGVEASASTDSAVPVRRLGRTATETSLSTDSAVPVRRLGRTGSETSLSTDAAAPRILRARIGVETSLSSDAAIRAALLPARTASDTSVGSDAATRTARFARSVSETSLSSDAATRVDRLARFGSDASLSSDVATGAVVAAGLNRTAADTSASSDTATRVGLGVRTGTEVSLSLDAAAIPGRFALIQRFTNGLTSGSAPTQTIPVLSNTAAGNFAILAVRCAGTVTIASASDSQGNTWHVDAVNAGGAAGRLSILSARLTTALTTADTITLNLTSGTTAQWAGYEYSGIATSPLDQSTVTNSGGSTTSLTVGPTGTTIQAAELAVTVYGSNKTQTSVSVDSAWTIQDSGEIAAASTASLQYADQALAATGTPSATWTIGTSAPMVAALATYQLAGGGATLLTRTGADTSLSSDTAARGVVLARAAVDASLISDSAGRAVPFARATGDTSLSSDSAGRAVPFVRAVSDVSGSTDVATRVDRLVRTASDASASSDSAAAMSSRARSAPDTSLSSDAAISTTPSGRTTGDTNLSSDAATRVDWLVRTAPDVNLSSDTATGVIAKVRFTADVSSSSDVTSRAVRLIRSTADISLDVDVATRVDRLTRTATDVSASGDAAQALKGFIRLTADISLSTDAATRIFLPLRTSADANVTSDVAQSSKRLSRQAVNTSLSSDAATRVVRFTRIATDTSLSSDALPGQAAPSLAFPTTAPLGLPPNRTSPLRATATLTTMLGAPASTSPIGMPKETATTTTAARTAMIAMPPNTSTQVAVPPKETDELTMPDPRSTLVAG